MPALRLAVVDDYEIVVAGVARMLEPYRERVEVVQLAPDTPVTVDVDVALYDTFAQGEADGDDLDVLLANSHAKRVVVYTWAFDERLVDVALAKGARGYLSKSLRAEQVVEALEQVHAGDVVVSPPLSPAEEAALDWPGRSHGLSERESEIVALITQGKSNAEIAALTFLSPNTVKGYIRSAYRKLDVRSRSQAVLWGVTNGFHTDGRRLDLWRLAAKAAAADGSG